MLCVTTDYQAKMAAAGVRAEVLQIDGASHSFFTKPGQRVHLFILLGNYAWWRFMMIYIMYTYVWILIKKYNSRRTLALWPEETGQCPRKPGSVRGNRAVFGETGQCPGKPEDFASCPGRWNEFVKTCLFFEWKDYGKGFNYDTMINVVIVYGRRAVDAHWKVTIKPHTLYYFRLSLVKKKHSFIKQTWCTNKQC